MCEQYRNSFQQYVQEFMEECEQSKKFYFPEGMRIKEDKFNTLLNKIMEEENQDSSKFREIKEMTALMESEQINLRRQLRKSLSANSNL